jgi:hypothetical protein
MSDWSRKYDWTQRGADWDAHQDQIRQQAFKEEIEKVARRHAQVAGQHIAALVLPVQELARRINAKQVDMADVPDKELIRMVQQSAPALKALVEVERISNSMHTEHQAHSNPAGGPIAMTITDAVRNMFESARKADAEEKNT